MAEAFLKEIYDEANLFFELKRLLEAARVRDVRTFKLTLDRVLPLVDELCTWYSHQNNPKRIEFWKKSIQEILRCKADVLRVGDCLEGQVLPEYQAYLSKRDGICVDDGEGFCLQSSQSGFLTMQLTDSGQYLHSAVDPMWEAYLMAKQIFDPQKEYYSVWGDGLGYFSYQLYCYTGGSAKIRVFEPNEKMARYGLRYGVLEWIPEDRMEITVSEDFAPFLDSLQDGTAGFYIHEPAFAMLRKEQQGTVNKLLIIDRTKRHFAKENQINYWRNTAHVYKTISDFDKSLMKKEVVVVAAGPSLDAQLDYLREVQGKKSIIAVGTVFSKLMKEHIRPDIVTISDPQKNIKRQIEGLDDETVPLFLGITAYWELALDYRGDKYLVLTQGEQELAAEYAKQKKETFLYCGGTVTTMAITVALYLGAESIDLAGVDLAYPNRISHASDTLLRKEMKEGGLIRTECVDGGWVYTAPSFNIYREEIEKIIRENPEVGFVNLSGVGAKIKGAKERKQAE